MARLHLIAALAASALALSACASSAPSASEAALARATLESRLASLATPDNDVRRDTIVRQLTSAGFNVKIETFEGGTKAAPETGYNIVAEFGPQKKGREILLVAHYDAIQLKGAPAMGIVDNAASVVAMTTAAEKLKAAKLDRRIRLLFTDQEELGLLGAKAWIATHGLTDVTAVVNADVAAYGDTLMYGLNTGDQSARVIAALEHVCEDRAMPCRAMKHYPPSDDVAFAQAGAPVVSIGFQPADEAERLEAFMMAMESGRQPDGMAPAVLMLIHTPNDALARADLATIATAAETFEALTLRLDRTMR
jgi:Zn-dependent M28 family amino/carboxypeptidase